MSSKPPGEPAIVEPLDAARRHRCALQAAGALVYEVDIDRDRILAIEGSRRLLGIAAPKIPASSSEWWLSRLDEGERRALLDAIERARAGGSYTERYRWRDDAGDMRVLEDSGRWVDGRVVGTVLDVTQESELTETLAARLEELEILHGLATDVATARAQAAIHWSAVDAIMETTQGDRASLLVFDPDGVMRFKSWRHLSAGYREAVSGHSPWVRGERGAVPFCIPDVAKDPSLDDVREAVLAEGIRSLAFVPVTIDGGVIGKFMIYRNEPGELSPERLRLCASIASLTAAALDRAQRQRSLADSEARLRRADKRKDEFLALLGHELRNPLAALDVAIRLLDHDANEPDAVREIARRMSGQARQLTILVNDLLDVTRISRGKLKLHPERIDMRAVVDRAVESLEARLRSHDQHVEVDIDDGIELIADPVRLEQVLCNLLSNASRYSARSATIRLEAERDPDDPDVIVVRVCDSGVGIDHDKLEAIFEAFEQVPGGPPGGLGIGLALVRQLVSLHGGSVEAQSEGAGRGSTFVVRLPRSPRRGTAAHRAAPRAGDEPLASDSPTVTDAAPPARAPAARRVLIVDDNEDAAWGLATLLRFEGHEIETATTGNSALALLRERGPFDAILLDVGLPDIDGFEVARQIAESPHGRPRCLIAVTGFGDETTRREATAAGFDDIVLKPVTLEGLRERLQFSPSEPA